MSKESLLSSRKLELQEVKRAVYENSANKVIRLEQRAADLQGDIDTLQESLFVHKRDREKAFRDLIKANETLQDQLTKALLWRIQELSLDVDDEGGRKGLAGVLAEFLGRLLVLEKEGAQASYLLENETPPKDDNAAP